MALTKRLRKTYRKYGRRSKRMGIMRIPSGGNSSLVYKTLTTYNNIATTYDSASSSAFVLGNFNLALDI